MRFPYFQLGLRDFAPIIPLALMGKFGWMSVEAYIDSGASFSIFNTERAEILGVNYKKGKKIHLTVGDGGLLEVYLCNLRTRIGKFEFNAPIGFSSQLGVSFNLLGRKGLFDRFVICFNDKKHFVEINHI